MSPSKNGNKDTQFQELAEMLRKGMDFNQLFECLKKGISEEDNYYLDGMSPDDAVVARQTARANGISVGELFLYNYLVGINNFVYFEGFELTQEQIDGLAVDQTPRLETIAISNPGNFDRLVNFERFFPKM